MTISEIDNHYRQTVSFIEFEGGGGGNDQKFVNDLGSSDDEEPFDEENKAIEQLNVIKPGEGDAKASDLIK